MAEPAAALAEEPHWQLLGTALWGVALLAAFFLVQTAVTALVILGAKPEMSEAEFAHALAAAGRDGAILSRATVASAVVCSLLLFGMVKLKRGATLARYLALRPVALPVLARWLGLMLLLLAASDTLTWLMGRPIVPPFVMQAYATADPPWLAWFAFVVAAPVFEELFFRGFLFQGLARLGGAGAVALTALVWSLLHLQYDWYGILTVFAIGLVLGAARLVTGSLLTAIALHSLSSLAATVEALVLR